MGKENFVLLNGQLASNAQIWIDKEGNPKKAVLSVKVMRRQSANTAGFVSIGKTDIDYPIVISTNPDIIRICSGLRLGDFVEIKGVYTTRPIGKKTECPNHHVYEWKGTYAFVTPIHIEVKEQRLDEQDGFTNLRKRTEISNVIKIIGRLCRDPEIHEFERDDGRKSVVCQYQIAANRSYHIRDGIHEDERTDYPWIKTSGNQAKEDFKRLHTGSDIFVNGTIQTREVKRAITCEECGAIFTITEPTSEIYPYNVEYLANFNAVEEDDATDIKNSGTETDVSENV